MRDQWIAGAASSFIVFFGCVCLGIMACGGPGAASGSLPLSDDTTATKEPASVADADALGKQYRELRLIRGHFGGGAWDDRVDKWMSVKHRVMLSLADLLTRPPATVSRLHRVMGRPDRVGSMGDGPLQDMRNSSSNGADGVDGERVTEKEACHIYYWRHTHDYLVFICRGNKVRTAFWQYAGE